MSGAISAAAATMKPSSTIGMRRPRRRQHHAREPDDLVSRRLRSRSRPSRTRAARERRFDRRDLALEALVVDARAAARHGARAVRRVNAATIAAALVVLPIPMSPSASTSNGVRSRNASNARTPAAITASTRSGAIAGPRLKFGGPASGTDVDQLRCGANSAAHAEIRNVDLGAHCTRERTDGREAAEKPADHLGRHFGRIGTHAVGGDAVIAGADQNRAALEVMRRHAARDRAQLHRERLDAAETADGFGEMVDAPAGRGRDARIGCRDRVAHARQVHRSMFSFPGGWPRRRPHVIPA